jgi:hypothetical protein
MFVAGVGLGGRRGVGGGFFAVAMQFDLILGLGLRLVALGVATRLLPALAVADEAAVELDGFGEIAGIWIDLPHIWSGELFDLSA